MKIKVKAQPGQVCRLSDSVCVTEKEKSVELTTTVRRRIKDGSLIDCSKKRGKSK
ncbi:hypothetical protein [Amphritea sp. HPY]|uniref:hypothetical protein n=1 Tax=Amphritea sp. HPY TaxID=3421652 RepID=UPI003D7E42B1